LGVVSARVPSTAPANFGVVESNVEVAKVIEHLLHHGFYALGIRQVAGDSYYWKAATVIIPDF
jgi:hypothetical protein